MKKLCSEFFSNLKKYIDYLMKVDYKELFINVVILFCIIVLSAIVYLPIASIEDLIRSFIRVYSDFNGYGALLFDWVFKLISFISALIFFMFLFNKRFNDIEALKEQVKGNKKVTNKEAKEEKDDLDLPKVKDKK